MYMCGERLQTLISHPALDEPRFEPSNVNKQTNNNNNNNVKRAGCEKREDLNVTRDNKTLKRKVHAYLFTFSPDEARLLPTIQNNNNTWPINNDKNNNNNKNYSLYIRTQKHKPRLHKI